ATLREAPDPDDLRLSAGRIAMLGDERHLPVVVDEADAGQALVRRPLVELQIAEVARVDRLVGERLVEADHERLILGPDGTDRQLLAARRRPAADVLRRVGPDGRP